MKFILIFLLFYTSQSLYPVSLKITNHRECKYKITLKGYNSTIYKIVYLDPGKSTTVYGNVKYPYFKARFEQIDRKYCGCATKVPDCPDCEIIEKLWNRNNDFELFLKLDYHFHISKSKCSRV